MMESAFPQLPGLVIGRFQPVHKGHLDALRQAFEQEAHLLIVIGSAENDYELDNPFTASERYQMLAAALATTPEWQGRFSIVPIRDINNHSLWVGHLENLLPPFGVVYTGSPIVTELFLQDGKHDIHEIKKNLDLSATGVRDKILNEQEWEEDTPAGVAELLKKWNAQNRIQTLKKNVTD